jgi:4-diphosphocytidyl-2-C-methyl-D-erythritol kinase
LVDITPLQIHIQKRIPIEAGLGGGSSNAAAVIRSALKFTTVDVPSSDLLAVAAACGSDVPFFLLDSPRARATGRGEHLEALDATRQELLLANPGAAVSTAEAYRLLDARRKDIAAESANDFEIVAPTESLEIMKALLSLGAGTSHLCGSGSAVYGTFASAAAADEAAEAIQRIGLWSARCHTIGCYDEEGNG